MSTTIILERLWRINSPTFGDKPFAIRIHAPVLVEGDAVCKLEYGDETAKLIGIDAWQAVRIAMDFAKSQVSYFESKGATFCWENGGLVNSTML